MSMDRLMLFRTIYLRSIAEAWADPTFRGALLDDPVGTMQRYFSFSWPWGRVCSLQVIEDDQRLQWIRDRWVWARNLDEGLTMYVPLAPPTGTENDFARQSQALADWYRQRSSLFSDDWGTEYDENGPVTPGGQDAHPTGSLSPAVGADSAPPDGGYMPSSVDFDSFKVVLLAAIAKAWGDDRYRAELVIDPKTALREIRGYELPWNLGISICHDPAATWHPPGDPGGPDGAPHQCQSYWSDGTPHVLTLYLPAAPQSSELACEPIALAMYNAAGAQYPFTCCCDPG